jgi:hypothetical protein
VFDAHLHREDPRVTSPFRLTKPVVVGHRPAAQFVDFAERLRAHPDALSGRFHGGDANYTPERYALRTLAAEGWQRATLTYRAGEWKVYTVPAPDTGLPQLLASLSLGTVDGSWDSAVEWAERWVSERPGLRFVTGDRTDEPGRDCPVCGGDGFLSTVSGLCPTCGGEGR